MTLVNLGMGEARRAAKSLPLTANVFMELPMCKCRTEMYFGPRAESLSWYFRLSTMRSKTYVSGKTGYVLPWPEDRYTYTS
jgi:hypothetical protein